MPKRKSDHQPATRRRSRRQAPDVSRQTFDEMSQTPDVQISSLIKPFNVKNVKPALSFDLVTCGSLADALTYCATL